MRRKHTQSGLTVNAVAGTHVVSLGFDLAASKRAGCLGFAVRREDHTEAECSWMLGTKTFEATDPRLGPGGQASCHEHPFQSFQWADYSAKPEHEYTYTVTPLYGSPAKLRDGDDVSVRVQTEAESGARHSVFFNRGAVSSQEYARRFFNKRPDEVGPEAYKWLSRGLLEALLRFIDRAEGEGYGLYGAVYEFQWKEVLEALRRAHQRGVRVKVVFDAVPGKTTPRAENLEAINSARIKGLCIERSAGKLMHNKFFVLTKDDRPIAVWTGSTNLTENGIFGHSNCGHVVEDPAVARAYLDYWKTLSRDLSPADMRARNEAELIVPPSPWDADTVAVFSPRRGLSALDWYAEIVGSAERALFMTFAFGMHKKFQEVFERNDGVLRFALMEKEGNGRALEQGRKDIARIRRRPNVIVAVANDISMNSFDCWLKEREKLHPDVNVKWIHTKYALVDPLGCSPILVTGSANFSEASTNTNDENMLVIRNDTRIADIYFGEYMRLYTHYAFREAVEKHRGIPGDNWTPKYLCGDDTWQLDAFEAGSPRWLRRRYFAGT